MAPLLALLSRLVLRELDSALLAVVCQPDVLDVLDKAEPGCAAYLLETPWGPAAFEVAAVDFTGLFLLPQGVQPQASAWLPGERERVGTHITGLVRQAMAVLHVQAEDADIDRLPPDHLATLLSLISYAVRSEHPLERQIGQDLFAQALAPWLAAFGAALHSRATTPLYRALGSLMAQIVPDG